jgi:hypothetical protein
VLVVVIDYLVVICRALFPGERTPKTKSIP